mmetsp:Transcript_13499/g.33933  ORF Transcript_13499/g.33933 Transcript_13499/m.33933 type:complete len:141 (+) Transcript_13499:104-526(+)
MRSETQTSIPYEVLGCLKSLTIKTQKITCSLRKKLEKKILYRCLVENLYGLRHLKDSNKCQQLNERTIPVQEPSIKKLSIDWSSVQSYEIGKTSMSERGKVGMRCSSFVNYNHNSFLDSDGFPFVEGLDEIEFQSLGGSS